MAPVIAYVPEGDTDPPTSHMRFPGTITVPKDVFERTIDSAAESFRIHGFLDVVCWAITAATKRADGTIGFSRPAAGLAQHLLGALIGVRVLAHVHPERPLLQGIINTALLSLDGP